MWIYVYDAAACGINDFHNAFSHGVPVTGATFGSFPPVSGSPCWYQINLPPNTNFSCAASGYNTVYTNTNGYTQMAIGLQKTGGK